MPDFNRFGEKAAFEKKARNSGRNPKTATNVMTSFDFAKDFWYEKEYSSHILQVVVQDDFSVFRFGNNGKARPRPS